MQRQTGDSRAVRAPNSIGRQRQKLRSDAAWGPFFSRTVEIIEERGAKTFVDHLGALATAVAEKVPMGQVWKLGDLNGQPIFGAIRNGLGIVDVNGTTMVVHAPQGGPVTILGKLVQ